MKWLARMLLIGVALSAVWLLRPKRSAPGVLMGSEPVQTELSSEAVSMEKAGFSVRPLARFAVEARLLHKKRYYSDPVAELAPFDFAIGWGPMSDQRVLDQLTITQGNRFFFWEYEREPPIATEQLIRNATNLHLIPADFGIKTRLWWAHAGDLIRLSGYLIEAEKPNMPPWRSSLTRADTGKGACEIVWVDSFEKIR